VSAAPSQRLTRRDRVRRRIDYERVSREGIRVTTQCFLVLAASTHPPRIEGPSRLGLTVSRRVGGSVVRSRVKRRIREWFRRDRAALPPARDVVVIARPCAATLTHDETRSQLHDAATRLHARLASKAARG